MNILVVAPHPDDEVMGCGGTIARHTQNGDAVYLLIVTKAYTPEWSEKFIKNRPKEVDAVNKILGIKKTFFLDFPTVKLDTIPQKTLNAAIEKVVKEVAPDVMYIPHKGDLNRDHRLVFEAALVATRPFHNSVDKIMSYEVLSETDWGQALEVFVPSTYIDISAVFAQKIEAMKVYSSEIKEYPHPRSFEIIETLAKKRGSECGFKMAEGFIVIREIIQ